MGTSGQPEYLSTADAAETLAVSVSTVKRWVDEGILPAHVTAGGHRKLLRSEVLVLARKTNLPRGEVVEPGCETTNSAVLAKVLLDALVAGNGPAANGIIRRAYHAGLAIDSLADHVIAPVLADVGHQWETARLDVWHEHRATELCAAALHDLRRELEARAERDRPVAIGAAPEGDPYSLPTLLSQLVLLDAGWQAINLGPNTPLASLTNAMLELRPRLVWLSVTFLRNDVEFLRTYREFYRAAEQQGVAVAVGGQALVSSVRSSMSYTTYGDGMSHFAAFARTLHPRPKRPRRGRPPHDSPRGE
ncbi:MAG: helix-turn-helix domain-containing protein [Gemmataceae bacterium]